MKKEQEEKLNNWFQELEKFSITIQALLIREALDEGGSDVVFSEGFGKWAIKNKYFVSGEINKEYNEIVKLLVKGKCLIKTIKEDKNGK